MYLCKTSVFTASTSQALFVQSVKVVCMQYVEDQPNAIFVEHYAVWQYAETTCSLLRLKFLTFLLFPSYIVF